MLFWHPLYQYMYIPPTGQPLLTLFHLLLQPLASSADLDFGYRSLGGEIAAASALKLGSWSGDNF